MGAGKNNKIISFFKRYGLSFIVLVFLFVYLSKNVSLKELAAVLSTVDIKFYLIAGFASYMGLTFRAFRWTVFTEQLKKKVKFTELVKMLYFSSYLNFLIPGRAGDFFSLFYLKKHDISTSHSLGSMFLERITDFLYLLVALVISAPFSVLLIKNADLEKHTYFALTLGVVMICIIIAVPFIFIKKKSWAKKIPFVKKFDVETILNNFEEGIKVIGKGKKAVFKYILFTLVRWIPEFLVYYIIFYSMGITNLNPLLVFAFSLVCALMYAIPLFPGALGMFEGFVILFFAAIGYTHEHAITFALINRSITLLFFILPMSVLVHKIGKEIKGLIKKKQ